MTFAGGFPVDALNPQTVLFTDQPIDAVVTVLRGVTFCVRELLQVSNAVIFGI